MELKDLTLITGNINKYNEFKNLLHYPLKYKKIDLPELQDIEVANVVTQKAKEAFSLIKKPVMIEDTGLSFEQWNGLPGALIKWFLETVGTTGLLRMIDSSENRNAMALTVVGICIDGDVQTFEGFVKGTISETPRGTNGFGWDEIFIPEGYDLTFAEMDSGTKNAVSMRYIAIDKLRDFLMNL